MTPFFLVQFLDFLEYEKRYSSHTITAYKKDLEQFLDLKQRAATSDVTLGLLS